MPGIKKIQKQIKQEDFRDPYYEYNEEIKQQVGQKRPRSKPTKYDNIRNAAPSKRRKVNEVSAKNFIEDQAEEASDEDYYEEDSETEIKGKEKQYYNEKDLQRKTNTMNAIKNLEAKYEHTAAWGPEQLQQQEEDSASSSENIDKQGLLPSINDPKLWQVKVKTGSEKVVCLCLINKCMDYAKRGEPLSIISATSTEKVQGYIFIEAFKEIHVKEAIKGMPLINNKIMLIDRQEMPNIFEVQQKPVHLEKYQWVRINQGLYEGDLGLVYCTNQDNQVWVRLIPRMEIDKSKRIVDNSRKQLQVIQNSNRPQQKLIFPDQLNQAFELKKDKNVGKTFSIVQKKFMFYKGFIFKLFRLKQLQIENVKPTLEEVQQFANFINKVHQEQGNIGDDSDDEEIRGDLLVKRALLDLKQDVIAKGDKIKVKKGDLVDLCGEVISVENGYVIFKPMMDGICDTLKIEESFVQKYFEPGDQVRVIDGKFKGETGIIVKSYNDFCSIILSNGNREIRVLSNYLKLKSEIDQTICQLSEKRLLCSNFEAGDFISYNNSKNVAAVLQVQEDFVRAINDLGEIKNIKKCDIDKKFERDRKQSTIDSERNTLYPDNVVKVIAGKYKGRKGVIKYIFKNTLFLWDREFQQSHGIFVETTPNVLILGNEYIKMAQTAGGAVASMNRKIKDTIIGKDIVITAGQWKGYRGRVVRTNESQAIVELCSKNKQIAVDRTLVELAENKYSYNNRRDLLPFGGLTAYECDNLGGKTPIQVGSSYYPNSPHWGAQFSPARDNDTEFGAAAFSRPGSQWR